MAATLLISSKNYSSWSLRGFLLARLSRLDVRGEGGRPDDHRHAGGIAAAGVVDPRAVPGA